MRIITTRKTIIACVMLGTVALAAPVFAGDAGLYIGGALGANRLKGVGENPWRATPMGTVGYAFSNGLRPEAELSYRYSGSGNSNVTATSEIANLYYDIWNDGGYYFSFGGGVGKSRLKLNGAGGGGSSDSPTVWQAGIGFGGALTDHLTLGLDYRQLQSFSNTQFNIGGTTSTGSRYKAQTISLQLRYFFGGTSGLGVAMGPQPVRVVPVQ